MFLFPKENPQGFASGLEAHVGDHEVGDQREQPGARWRSHQDPPHSYTKSYKLQK